jgi:hypothetical protein
VAEGSDGFLADVLDGFLDRISHENEIEIGGADCSRARHIMKKAHHLPPILRAQDDDWKILDLAGLYQRQRLEQFVHRARSAWEHDEGVAIFHQQSLADEEVVHRHATVEVVVRLLLEGKLDVAADRAAARLLCAAIGRFHDARPASRHHREAQPCNRRAHLPREVIVRIVFASPGRTEHRHARPHEVQHTETAQEIP